MTKFTTPANETIHMIAMEGQEPFITAEEGAEQLDTKCVKIPHALKTKTLIPVECLGTIYVKQSEVDKLK